MSTLRRGAFIVIEGVDRSGKSTQCRKLVENLLQRKIAAELKNFPDRSTPTGKVINQYLQNSDFKMNDNTIHLFFSANRWEKIEQITSLINSGVTIVVDRYSYSGIAFSAVKENMDLNWCKQPENGLPKPDLVFLLTLNPEELAKRPGFGNERYENVEVQRKVAHFFDEFCDERDNWRRIDASGSAESVQNKLIDLALLTIKEVEKKPLQVLRF